MTIKDLLESDSIKFIFFGGKGGVGKTTCASAAAIYAAKELGKATLIISTDPAHSLSDSFDYDLSGGEIKVIPQIPNLYAQEINPEKAMEEFRGKLLMAQQEDMNIDNTMIDMYNLGGLTLPGMDEALAFSKVLELIKQNDYDLIIFDTAPTGHTLRLLSLPDVLNSMLGKLIKMQLWVKNLFGSLKRLFGQESVEDKTLEYLKYLQELTEDARKKLSDEKLTSFVPVMIPAVMAIEETERLLSTLYTYQIPVKNIVVNMISPENPTCPFCSKRYKIQQKELEKIRKLYEGDFDLIYIPMFAEEIRGIEKLEELSKYLIK